MSKKKPVVNEDNIFDSFKELLDSADLPQAEVETSSSEKDKIEDTTVSFILHQAHNVYFDKTKKKFMLVLIDYNIDNGYAKINSITELTDNLAVAVAKTTERLTKKLFKGEETV